MKREFVRDGTSWSPSEEAILRRAYLAGVHLAELSNRHLRSVAGLRYKLIEWGWLDDSKLIRSEHWHLIEAEPANSEDEDEATASDAHEESACQEDEPFNECEDYFEYTTDAQWTVHDDTPRRIDDDWGDVRDDLGPEDWENYWGGPDDDTLEEQTEDRPPDIEDVQPDEEPSDDREMDKEQRHDRSARQAAIVDWLSGSKLARRFHNRQGFFVFTGRHVRLKDGSIVDLLDWLTSEGIKGGATISGFSVVYTEPGKKYGEKLSFFKNGC